MPRAAARAPGRPASLHAAAARLQALGGAAGSWPYAVGPPSPARAFLGVLAGLAGAAGHPAMWRAPGGQPGAAPGRGPECGRHRRCQSARMGTLDELRAERDELERRLVELEQAVSARLAARDGAQAEAVELAVSVEELLARLGPVNAKLAELRGPGAST